MEVLAGILYGFIGVYLVMHPVRGLESLTLALAIYLLLQAILEFVLGFTIRPLPGSAWLVFNGVITLILAFRSEGEAQEWLKQRGPRNHS